MREAKPMSATNTTRPARKRWRWLALGTLGVAGAFGGWYYFRSSGLTPVQAQPATPAPQAASATAADYDHRVVAYLNETEAVTRDELAEYLVPRRGPEKLDALINRRIIEFACKEKKIEVSAAEIEQALAESIKSLNIDRARFVKEYLKGIRKNMFEWKEDVLRPRLILTKMCQDRVHVTPSDIQQAFESQYGEKVECRIIVWPVPQAYKAEEMYASLRDSEEAFALAAKNQFNSTLASMGGRVKPVGRHTFTNQKVEDAVFRLHPGEVSELIGTTDGVTLIKCDKRLPADTTVSIDAKREELTMFVFERKLQMEMGKFVKEARDRAAVKPAFPDPKDPVRGDLKKMGEMLRNAGPPNQVLATIYGNVEITRGELAEYLMVRYGADALELLLNRKIIDKACQAKGITVSDQEVEAAFQEDLARLKVDEKHFIDEFLVPNGKSPFEYREDNLRPKLMMTKLAREQTKVTEEDLHQAFDATYGERVKGRLIMWKSEEKRIALAHYNELKKEAEFDKAARQQFNPGLAAQAGHIPAFARHTTGIDKLEEEAFKLQPGEISALIELPEGCAIFRCDERLPPQGNAKFEEKRAELTPLVIERKTLASIPVVFNELRTKANPRSLLKSENKPEDLEASVQRDLEPPTAPAASGQPVPPRQMH
jgi:parvulin-like peptidyl-prolyl isomerase